MIQSHEMSRDALSRLRSTREVRKAKRTQPSVRGAHRRALDARYSVSAAMNLAHQTLRVGTGFPALARRATGAGRARARAQLAVHMAIRPVETPGVALAREGSPSSSPWTSTDRRPRRESCTWASAGFIARISWCVPPSASLAYLARDPTRPGVRFVRNDADRSVLGKISSNPRGDTARRDADALSRAARVDRADAFLLTQNRPRAYCGAREARPRPAQVHAFVGDHFFHRVSRIFAAASRIFFLF